MHCAMLKTHVPVVVHAFTVCFQLFWSLCIEVFQPVKLIKHIRRQDCKLHLDLVSSATSKEMRDSQIDCTSCHGIPLLEASLGIFVFVLAL